MRTISDAEIRVLTGATEADYILGGGVSLLEMFTRVRVSTLSKYASNNEEHSESLMPIDVAIEADRFSKSPVIVTAMAKLLGFRLVRDEEAAALSIQAATLDDLLRVIDEVGDVVREARRAMADGIVDAADKKAVNPEIDEAMRALGQFREKFNGGRT